MDTRNKSEKFWDRMANYFDREERKDELNNIKIIEKTKGHLKISDNVLDYGCGTGTADIQIADHVKNIYGIDISSKMIDAAKTKAAMHRMKNIDFVQTTIFDEKLKKGSFDVILSFYILHLVEDMQMVMQRINELLKPGGLIISATPCLGEKPLLNSLFSIGSIIGITPKIKSFKIFELEHSFKKENFEIIETGCLKQNSPQYLLIARKLKSV